MYQRRGPIDLPLDPGGACCEDLFQAQVAVHFGDSETESRVSRHLGLCDLSFLPKLGVKGPGAEDWLKGLGLPAPDQIYHLKRFDRGAFIARLDRHEFFIEDNLDSDRVRGISQALGRGQPDVYRVERQDASFFISGSRALRVLAQTCGYNFEEREEKLVMTRVAVVTCAVLPVRMGGLDGFRIWTSPSQGRYLWQSLLAIVRDLAGSRIGIGCLR